MVGLITILSIFVYILIGWFVRALIQEDWEEPSMLLALVWPLASLVYLVIHIFVLIEVLANKIKEKMR